jgi:hypothetical protein
MKNSGLLLLAFVLLLPAGAYAQADAETPQAEGCVTRVSSSTDFDVNGTHITVTPETTLWSRVNSSQKSRIEVLTPHLGDTLTVFGKASKKTHSVDATRIIVPPPNFPKLAGEGIVDRVMGRSSSLSPAGRLVSADGYLMLLPDALGTPPLIAPNMWIEFAGRPRPDGILVLEKAKVSANEIGERERKLIDKYNYDPAAVPLDSGQASVHKALLGVNPRMIPHIRTLPCRRAFNRSANASSRSIRRIFQRLT